MAAVFTDCRFLSYSIHIMSFAGVTDLAMKEKMPYYMAYPMPYSFDDERTERMDYEYLQSMYPDMAKRILPYVEEECDRLEYENSMIYDQFPDRLQLRLLCKRVMKNAEDHEPLLFVEKNKNGKKDAPEVMRELIEVMVYQELYKRRSVHRRKYRRIY